MRKDDDFDELREKCFQGIKFCMKNDLDNLDKVSDVLLRMDKNAPASSSTIRRIYLKENVGQSTLQRIAKLLDEFAKSKDYYYNKPRKRYEPKTTNKYMTAHLVGTYLMFLLGSNGDGIIRQVVQINESGDVQIKGYRIMKGKAYCYKQSLLSICIDRDSHGPFFTQIIARIGLAGITNQVSVHTVYGIASTITSESLPMASRRVLIKVNDHVEAFDQYTFKYFGIRTPDWEELRKAHKNIVDYLRPMDLNINVIRSPLNAPPIGDNALGKVYFDAALQSIQNRHYDEAKQRLNKALLNGLNYRKISIENIAIKELILYLDYPIEHFDSKDFCNYICPIFK